MKMKCVVWPLGTFLFIVLPQATMAAVQDISSPIQRLVSGSDDVDTPAANAVVWANGCSGTLITPDIVVSAGHCFGQRPEISEGSGLPCADKEVPGEWYPVTGPIEVRVGNDQTAPRFTTTVTDYTLPGCVDIFLMRLAEPVPPSDATPVKVLTQLGEGIGAQPAAFFQGESFWIAGWGLTETGQPAVVRQTATMQYVRHDNYQMFVRGDDGAITDYGDSGGPLFWQHPSGQTYLVGVLQGPTLPPANENRYGLPFRNPGDGLTGVGLTFELAAPDAVSCDTFADRPEGTVALRSWWSPGRDDNSATTSSAWIGCTGSRRTPDYEYVRIEGYIFNPSLPQPPGTVRLYSWYDPDRGDNSTTSHPAWSYWHGGGVTRSPNYTLTQLEGFVFDPNRDQPPGTVPLYRWYSPGRGDNWTTTQFQDEGSSGAGLSPDYEFSRLVGYVYPASVQ